MPTIEGKSYAFSNCHEYFTEPTCNTLTVPLECNLLQSQSQWQYKGNIWGRSSLSLASDYLMFKPK